MLSARVWRNSLGDRQLVEADFLPDAPHAGRPPRPSHSPQQVRTLAPRRLLGRLRLRTARFTGFDLARPGHDRHRGGDDALGPANQRPQTDDHRNPGRTRATRATRHRQPPPGPDRLTERTTDRQTRGEGDTVVLNSVVFRSSGQNPHDRGRLDRDDVPVRRTCPPGPCRPRYPRTRQALNPRHLPRGETTRRSARHAGPASGVTPVKSLARRLRLRSCTDARCLGGAGDPR